MSGRGSLDSKVESTKLLKGAQDFKTDAKDQICQRQVLKISAQDQNSQK